MTDTERLDALALHGLCVAQHLTYLNGQWVEVWVCAYQDKTVAGPTVREVIDAAVLDLKTMGMGKH